MAFNSLKRKKIAYEFQPYDIPKLQQWLLQNVSGIQSQNPDDAISSLERFRPQIQQMGYTIEQVKSMLPDMLKNTKKQEDLQNTMPLPPLQDGQSTILTQPVASSKSKIKESSSNLKVFNLKKSQQMFPEPMYGSPDSLVDTPEIEGDKIERRDNFTREFSSGMDVRNWLTNQTDLRGALNLVAEHDDGSGKADVVKELIESFYEALNNSQITNNDRELEKMAGEIYDNMPETMKSEGQYMAQFKEFSAEDVIKKIAKEYVQKEKSKSFNLTKTAQHKTQENVIMWGPSDTRKVDPFSRQPVSDWHIIERNKGFGLVVDDVWNIDYETIWRQNVMDKYSRPYRDKEGNWVGGYIQKRFEVDKNIPVTNNIQLKPGQKRKPILPEYGNIESRLQSARAAGEIEGSIDNSKPFNWKKAQSSMLDKNGLYDDQGRARMCNQCWVEHGQHGGQCIYNCGCHDAYHDLVNGLIEASSQNKKKR